MKLIKKITFKQYLFGVFLLFIGISFLIDFSLGKTIGLNFKNFAWQMLTILPPIFILIGLFEVWVKKKL